MEKRSQVIRERFEWGAEITFTIPEWLDAFAFFWNYFCWEKTYKVTGLFLPEKLLDINFLFIIGCMKITIMQWFWVLIIIIIKVDTDSPNISYILIM